MLRYYLGNTAESRSRVLPILFHGDASFAGQGVVYETMQLAHVQEFDVGGTIHVIINNQVGFTTDPVDDRSTMYTSDVGKTFNLPILHVNGDDPVAVISAFELAAEWRQTWQTDVILDVICYRRFGHNETDAPEYTQPVLYKQINKHPRTEAVYAKSLIDNSVASQQELDSMKSDLWKQHEAAFKAGRGMPFFDRVQRQKDRRWEAPETFDLGVGEPLRLCSVPSMHLGAQFWSSGLAMARALAAGGHRDIAGARCGAHRFGGDAATVAEEYRAE
eukprot:symbB.v1.2.006546.t3/scaffold391.1/size216359/1